MKVQAYLMFEGRCDEALEFYGKALGAKVGMLMRFKDAPPPPPGSAPPPEGCAQPTAVMAEKVMHCDFTIGETMLMASDGMCSGKTNFQGISLTLSPASVDEAKKLFDALADGGQVQMPLSPSFFSPAFGMVADRFGVPWMVVAESQ